MRPPSPSSTAIYLAAITAIRFVFSSRSKKSSKSMLATLLGFPHPSHILGQIIEMGFSGVQARKVKDGESLSSRDGRERTSFTSATKTCTYHSPLDHFHIVSTINRLLSTLSPEVDVVPTYPPLLHTKRLLHDCPSRTIGFRRF